MLANRLLRLLYPYGAQRRVLRGPLRGLRFVAMPGMGASFALGGKGWNHAFLQPHLRPGMTVYDGGSNFGQMALQFAKSTRPDGKVVCFEPAPANVAVLRQNLALNGMTDVVVMEMALGASTGTRSFIFEADRPMQGSFEGLFTKLPEGQRALEVTCRPIDELVEEGLPAPDLIKIDVEGAGSEVIAGAERTIETQRPMIFFEVHGDTPESSEFLALMHLKDQWNYALSDASTGLPVEGPPYWGAGIWCGPPSKR